MDEKRRKILVRELCARLPYGVKVRTAVKYKTLDIELLDAIMDGRATFDILPLLRPMESMTEEEWRKMHNCCNAMLMGDKRICIRKSKFGSFSELQDAYTTIDWLLAHHFDYRGLIPMGLALPAPEGMYNIKG